MIAHFGYCGNYKVTVNQIAIQDTYPFPKVDDLLAALSDGETSTQLDLTHSYQQLVLDKESTKLVIVNTPQILFWYTKLLFGMPAAPVIFQCNIESLL